MSRFHAASTKRRREGCEAGDSPERDQRLANPVAARSAGYAGSTVTSQALLSRSTNYCNLGRPTFSDVCPWAVHGGVHVHPRAVGGRCSGGKLICAYSSSYMEVGDDQA